MGSGIAARFSTSEHIQGAATAVNSNGVSAPVFWVYPGHDWHWRVHKEGGAAEATFDSRDTAIAFLRDLVRDLPSYRLFIEEADGRIIRQESRQEPTARAEAEAACDVAAMESVAKPDATSGDELRRELAWADRLSSAARMSPSRFQVLADWFRAGRR
jgi:Uncharacterized protein conserved in bacteria (DUF2188)